MSKIIKFKQKSDNLVEYLENLIEIVKENRIDNIMVACKLEDYVMTGHHNLDMGTRQELLGHIQVDIVNEMIQTNYIDD